MVYQYKGGGIAELLRRARLLSVLDRVESERDKLADDLGIPLTAFERETLRSVLPETLRALLGALDGVGGPLERPRPPATFGRDRLTRGMRSGD